MEIRENAKYIAAAVGVVVLSIGAVLYISQRKPEAPAAAPVAVAPKPAPPPAEPEVKYPVAAAPAAEPLPSLEQSDAPLLNALGGLIGKVPAEKFVVPEGLVRKIVVTVDNLPNTKVAERLRPIKPVSEAFKTAGPEDAPTLDPANYERYKPMVELVRSLDDEQLMAIYARYYPLFQDAYENLGHPPKYFNDRLVEVIDHLLATPDVQGPIKLAQPGVLYEFADPNLESLSAGQKVLIRMGGANAAVVKEKLKGLRARLVEHKPTR
jgi:DUF3014 family protein